MLHSSKVPLSCDSEILEFYILWRAWVLRNRKIQLEWDCGGRRGKRQLFHPTDFSHNDKQCAVWFALRSKESIGLGQATSECEFTHPWGRTAHGAREGGAGGGRRGGGRGGIILPGWRWPVQGLVSCLALCGALGPCVTLPWSPYSPCQEWPAKRRDGQGR